MKLLEDCSISKPKTLPFLFPPQIVLSALIGAAVAVPAYGPAVISSGYGLGGLGGLGGGYGGYGAGIGAIGGYGVSIAAAPIAATTYRTQSSVLAPVGVVKSVVATPAITTIAAAPAIVSSGYGKIISFF